jgi:hypothetical protein
MKKKKEGYECMDRQTIVTWQQRIKRGIHAVCKPAATWELPCRNGNCWQSGLLVKFHCRIVWTSCPAASLVPNHPHASECIRRPGSCWQHLGQKFFNHGKMKNCSGHDDTWFAGGSSGHEANGVLVRWGSNSFGGDSFDA